MARRELRKVIKRLRERKKWSQRELAERVGVSQTTIALIESGDREPSLDVLRRLAQALGVTVSELLE